MTFSLQRWLRIALLNLVIVSIIGIVLRYKIIYPLPFVDQKHLLHGHSHFAFSGWVTQALMALLVGYLLKQQPWISLTKYNRLLWLNLFSAYGMLVSFPVQGYGAISISFSTLSIIVSYLFAIIYWNDLDKLPEKSTTHQWFKAALVFNAVSSIGTFFLAGMMIHKTVHQNWYLAAIYFFLHFQYNGWFFFSCMGLLFDKISIHIADQRSLRLIFHIFTLSCIPAYFLSALWLNIHLSVYIIVILASLAQVWAWFLLVKLIRKNIRPVTSGIAVTVKWVMAFSGLALSIKLLLQAGSVIPSLSNLAFGFRPVVIGYLHLVLLAVISLFIIGYILAYYFPGFSGIATTGVCVFAGGIIINESLLMIQGIAAMDYVSIPYINELLLLAAIMLFGGLFLLNLGIMHKKRSRL